MKAVTACPFALGADTVISLTPAKCETLKAAGMRFVVRYLGAIGQLERDAILKSGLALMLVTYAGHYDAAKAIEQLRLLDIPQGATVWLDVEGCTETAAELAAKCNAWAHSIKAAGWDPGIYVGAKCPLTSAQLYALAMDRYWHSCSRVVDATGAEAAPSCGWVMHQLNPFNHPIGDVVVDVNVIQCDYAGRLPTWVTGDETAAQP